MDNYSNNEISFCTVILLLTLLPSLGSDVGFELLFTSNLDTFEDFPIEFEHPVEPWIQGSIIRNGLGQFSMGPRRFTHAFDAYAKITKVSFNGTRTALFSTKFIQTDFYKDSVRSNTVASYILFEETRPKFNFLEKFMALVHGTDNTNVNIFSCCGKHNESDYLASSDFWPAYQINGSNLNTIKGLVSPLPDGLHWKKDLPLPSTSHPLQEYNSTNYISFVNVLNPLIPSWQSINLIRMTSVDKRELIASIQRDQIPYMHSFALTKNYAVIFASPSYVDTKKAVWENPLASIEWKPELGTDIYVVNLKTKEVISIHTTKAELTLHFINAWEYNNKIFVDYINYPDMDMMNSMQIDTLQSLEKRNNISSTPVLARYKINPRRKTVKRMRVREARPRTLFPVDHFDFPVINKKYRFRKNCYVYGVAMKVNKEDLASISLVKKDMCGGKKDKSIYIENNYFHEPHFIDKPNALSEDDGLLIVLALDGESRRSYVAIYDASKMVEINRAWLPTVIPFTLHGDFFPGQY